MKMRAFGALISPEEARRRLLRAVRPVAGSEVLPLAGALGRVAARTYRAPTAVPAFARATWDGYAIRSEDVRTARATRPVRLQLVGELFAEQSRRGRLGSGQAVAVATGAAVPPGANAVVIFEDVGESPDAIEVRGPVAPGNKIAAPGDDFPRGQTVVRAGEVIGPATLGALAATGFGTVSVRRRPRVGLVPNGNELVAPGRALGPGQIHESNNLTLASVVTACGGEPIAFPPVVDDPATIETTILHAVGQSDVVLVTGGSSVGEHDYLPAIFPRIGRLLFHGVSVRPGKPTLAARVGRRLLVGMPGHPTSCLSNAYWLLLPVLRQVAGLPGPGWLDGEVRLTRRIDAPSPGFSQVVPLRVADGWGTPTFRDSSAISSLAGANAFALRPPRSPAVPRGGRLAVHHLPAPLGVAN
jgi:molybdopterin molybdotransferase